jgi:hypothetical protein
MGNSADLGVRVFHRRGRAGMAGAACAPPWRSSRSLGWVRSPAPRQGGKREPRELIPGASCAGVFVRGRRSPTIGGKRGGRASGALASPADSVLGKPVH